MCHAHKGIQNWGNLNLFTVNHLTEFKWVLNFHSQKYPYLVCIVFGMPSLHLFTFLTLFLVVTREVNKVWAMYSLKVKCTNLMKTKHTFIIYTFEKLRSETCASLSQPSFSNDLIKYPISSFWMIYIHTPRTFSWEEQAIKHTKSNMCVCLQHILWRTCWKIIMQNTQNLLL